MEGKICSKCGQWKVLDEYSKRKDSKDGRQYKCRECQKEYSKQRWSKKHPKEVREGMKKCNRCGQWKPIEEFSKNKSKKKGRNSECKECQKEYKNQWEKKNPKYQKQWRENNPEHIKEYSQQHYKANAEHIKEYQKQHRKDNIENNLQYISSVVKQINPMMKDLPIYGYIYKFENIKTGHIYIGQTTTLLELRYNTDIIKGWIKDRKRKVNQKYLDELMPDDFIVTEVLDIGICKYHLDKLEAYYINKYDSYNNGYNNNAGNHNTDDGIEEFYKILEDHNLLFVDGEIISA